MLKALYPEISDACKRADTVLWDAYARSVQRRFGAGAGRLIFRRYREELGGDLRVSEQEARFAFVEALRQGPFPYSVETPTSKSYKFKGRKYLSAQTDLAVHNENGKPICNVEFKSKGVRPSAREHFPIYKDLQKLLREPVWGLWFHLLESTNNSTINDLLTVMARQMAKVRHECRDDAETPGLTLHVCVLQHGFSLQRDVIFPIDGVDSDDDLGAHLRVDLHVSRSKLLDVKDLNGWILHRHGAGS